MREEFEQLLQPPAVLAGPTPRLGVFVVLREVKRAQEVERAAGQVRGLLAELQVVGQVFFAPEPGSHRERERAEGGRDLGLLALGEWFFPTERIVFLPFRGKSSPQLLARWHGVFRSRRKKKEDGEEIFYHKKQGNVNERVQSS